MFFATNSTVELDGGDLSHRFRHLAVFLGFSSVDKESTCNAGDTCLIPGSGRSTGEGIGYQLQYSWAFFVAQLVKNLLKTLEIRAGTPPGEGKSHPLQYSDLENCSIFSIKGKKSKS